MALVLTYLGDMAREQGDEDRGVALYNYALILHRELSMRVYRFAGWLHTADHIWTGVRK